MGNSTNARFDVVGIGNAIVDVIAHADHHFIDEHDLVKGSMTLIDAERALELYRALGSAVEMSGGSAANTMCGVASFGGRAAYLGKVNDDELGHVFGHDLRAVGVQFVAGERDGDVPTGRSVIVVTPDAERTMNTFLGAAEHLGERDLDQQVIGDGAILYMEGYLYDRPAAKAAFRAAADIAHAAGRKVSLSLSDSFCVDRHRADFHELVRDQVDVLFGNEHELQALYETDSLDAACAIVREECELAIITRGANGSLVLHGAETVEIAAVGVNKVVDTTGAGDLFAAGFLFGLTRGENLQECGRLGSVAAAEVISHVGSRPLVDLDTLI